MGMKVVVMLLADSKQNRPQNPSCERIFCQGERTIALRSTGLNLRPSPAGSKTKPPMNLHSRAAFLSGREDLNLRPLQPHCSALAGLRYAPNSAAIITERTAFGKNLTMARSPSTWQDSGRRDMQTQELASQLV